MRWIACCALTAVVGLGLSMTLIRHFASKPTDPNLAELGLSANLDQLTAPEEPEAVPAMVQSGCMTLLPPQEIDLLANPSTKPMEPSEPRAEPHFLSVAFIDNAGVVALDDSARRWMPLCQEPEHQRSSTTDKHPSLDADRMPLCDEPKRLPLKPVTPKAR